METMQPALDITSNDQQPQLQQHPQSQLQSRPQPQPQQQPQSQPQPQSQSQLQQQHRHNKRQSQRQQSRTTQQSQSNKDGCVIPVSGGGVTGTETDTKNASFDNQAQSSMAYQHKHALHRLRRLKKRSPHRDLVISFVPRLRTSIFNRLDFFNRYSKQEQEVLSCFDFLDELVLTYCDGGLESPRYSQKLYEKMIYAYIE